MDTFNFNLDEKTTVLPTSQRELATWQTAMTNRMGQGNAGCLLLHGVMMANFRPALGMKSNAACERAMRVEV